VVAGLHAELDESSVNVGETEDIIVTQWREVSADDQHELRDRCDEILRPLGSDTRLVVVDGASSLALCFICMTLSAVMGLRDQWNSGQLGVILQSLLTFLLRAHQKVHVKRLRRTFQSFRAFFSCSKHRGNISTLNWPQNDYERCLDFFSFQFFSTQGLQSSHKLLQ